MFDRAVKGAADISRPHLASCVRTSRSLAWQLNRTLQKKQDHVTYMGRQSWVWCGEVMCHCSPVEIYLAGLAKYRWRSTILCKGSNQPIATLVTWMFVRAMGIEG